MNTHKEASCKCGKRYTIFVTMTESIRRFMNRPCNTCGTKLKYTKKKSLWQKIKNIMGLESK